MTILTRVELIGRSLARKYFPRKSMSALDYDPYDKEACEDIANTLLDEMYNRVWQRSSRNMSTHPCNYRS